MANGRPDSSFGRSATVVTDVTPAGACCQAQDDDARAVAIETDGTLVAVGASGTLDTSGLTVTDERFALARYTRDGSLDMSFGRGGKVLTGFGSNSSAWDAAIQPDGKILAAGYGQSSAKRDAFALARYRRDGNLDVGFGTGGKVTTDFGSR